MKKYFFIFLIGITSFNFTSGQILCIQCFDQNDSISSGVNNLLQNGGFENTTCVFNSNNNTFCPNSSSYNCDIIGWTCTGGGTSTYTCFYDSTYERVVEGSRAPYFGNSFCQACSPVQNDTSCLMDTGCAVTGIPAGYPDHIAAYGGNTGVSLEQTVNGLVPGNVYVLEFWCGGENFFGNFTGLGLFAVDVGFGNNMLRCKPTLPLIGVGTRYIIQFTATSSSHTIKFTNWGHVCSSCSELILDDVRLYTIAELSSSITPCGNATIPAVNLASSDTSWCDKKAIDYFDLSTNNPTSWQWFFPGAVPDTSTLQNPQGIYYPAYGSFDVKLIACNAAGCDTLFLPGFINEFQVPASPTITVTNDTMFVSSANSYQWYFNSVLIPGATDSFYVYVQQGSYYVIITDSNGCASSSGVINTGIHEMIFQDETVHVVPNPSHGTFEISFTGIVIPYKLAIKSLLGNVLYEGNGSENHLELNLGKVASGVYFLEIKTSRGLINRKIIVN